MGKILLQLIYIRRELSEIKKELLEIRKHQEPRECAINGKCLNPGNRD